MMLIIIIVIVVIIIVIIMKMVTIKEIERLLELHHKKGTRDRMDRNEMATIELRDVKSYSRAKIFSFWRGKF